MSKKQLGLKKKGKKGKVFIKYALEIEKEASGRGLIPPFDINYLLKIFYQLRNRVEENIRGKTCPIAILKTMHKTVGELFEVSGENPSLLMSTGLARKKLDCDLACGIYISIAHELNLPLRGAFLPSHTILIWGKRKPFLYFDTIDGTIWNKTLIQSLKVNIPLPISDKKFMSTYYNTVGVRFAEVGKHQDAIYFFNKALNCYSLDARLYYHKGVSISHLGDYKQAVNWCDKAINLDPSDWKAYFNMGVCLALAGKYKGAVSFYKRAEELHPKEYLIYYHRADALLRSGQLDLAIKDYEQALCICSDDDGLRKDYETALRYSKES